MKSSRARVVVVSLIAFAMATTCAFRVSAQTPQPTPTSTSSDAASTPTATATATANTTPSDEDLRPVEQRPVEHWYGWQPALFDLAAAIQAGLGAALNATPLYATAGATYFFGPVSVHLYHEHVGNIVFSAATRLLAPGVGAAGGFLVNKIASPSKDGGDATLVGLGIGCLAAAIIDDVVNSREQLQFWEQNTGINIAPIISPRSAGLSVGGSF